MIYDIGDALGPIAAGLLVASVGYARMFQVIAADAVVMAIVFAATSGPTARSPMVHVPETHGPRQIGTDQRAPAPSGG